MSGKRRTSCFLIKIDLNLQGEDNAMQAYLTTSKLRKQKENAIHGNGLNLTAEEISSYEKLGFKFFTDEKRLCVEKSVLLIGNQENKGNLENVVLSAIDTTNFSMYLQNETGKQVNAQFCNDGHRHYILFEIFDD